MIDRCLGALSRQTYSSDCFEVIVVDDRSDDDTGKIVAEFIKKRLNWRLFRVDRVPDGWAPKKFALSRGIQSSIDTADIIAFTDADCIPSPGWLVCIADAFDGKTGMVIGASPSYPGSWRPGGKKSVFEPGNFRAGFLTIFSYLETLALGSIASGSANLGYPLTCTGRNIAVRSKTLSEVGVYIKIKHFISGDDDLLLSRIRDHTNWEIRSLHSPEAAVWTHPPTSTRNLIQARLRHASKTLDYSCGTIVILSLLYLLHLTLLSSFLYAVFTFSPNKIILIFLPVKTLIDWLLLVKYAASRRFPLEHLVFLPVMELIFVFYVCILPPLSLVTGFTWKGARYRSRVTGRKPDTLDI